MTETTLKSWDDVEALLASRLEGYQARPQQQLLARTIEQALATRKSLMAQAGCGTGKSIGGMVPTLLHALMTGERVVVATATKALQEQYWNSDVPFLAELFASVGQTFTPALLKGRSNYACPAKMVGDEAEGLAFLPAILAELEGNPEHSGDREHFATVLEDADWRKISTSSNECPGKTECPFADRCFAEKAKSAARDADLVVTNTSMALMDAVVREMTKDNETQVEMLGHYDTILFDEAHEIAEYAQGALGFDFTARGMGQWATKAQTFCALQGVDVSELTDRFGSLLTTVENMLLPLVAKGTPTLTQAWFVENFEPFADLMDCVRDLLTAVSKTNISRDVDGQQAKKKFLRVQGTGIESKLRYLMDAGDHQLVRWVEVYEFGRNRDKSWKLCASPVDVAPFLRDAFWGPETGKTAILMSATLSAGKNRDGSADFSYLSRTLGLQDADTVDVGTPFNFTEQALMFVPDERQPSPKQRDRWMSYAAATTLAMVEAARGGALLLFTSRTAMEDAYRAMKDSLEMSGFTVLMQGNREPGRNFTNKELARRFKEDHNSVLFALKSFFVGVDVPGDACRLVIIDKLPFPVPSDPIFAARELAEKRAGRFPFNSLSIPMMTLTLEQGVGRLIRRVSDTGVVAVLDSRLSSERYGRQIVHNLPDFPVTTSLADVRDFYARKFATAA